MIFGQQVKLKWVMIILFLVTPVGPAITDRFQAIVSDLKRNVHPSEARISDPGFGNGGGW